MELAIVEMRYARKELGLRSGFVRPDPHLNRSLHKQWLIAPRREKGQDGNSHTQRDIQTTIPIGKLGRAYLFEESRHAKVPNDTQEKGPGDQTGSPTEEWLC